jgi:ubiquinone/menaquinone biosynthesis C-methylase UbiE
MPLVETKAIVGADAGAAPTANSEAIEAWNGVLFDRFLRFRHIVTTGLAAHGDEALRRHVPAPGSRVLDVGCGFGDTTLRLAELVGPGGQAVGIDAAERFVELARSEAVRAGMANARFLVGDAESARIDGRFDMAFSRFGTMFFANPVFALRNIRDALIPGGRLCIVVWRRKLDNDWLHRAELVVNTLLDKPEHSDEPTCGPGPFSMANADTTSQVLLNAGFKEVALRRFDHRIQIGRDLAEAVDFAMALGPAGEAIRLAGAGAERLRPRIATALRDALAGFAGPAGVHAPASTWIVEAGA